jgi:GNAT superfamily N-acetyltransferase
MKELRTGAHRIRAIDPQSRAEVELVASRMRQTLVEVLGEEVGGSMYTMDWLIQRVLWHLDPNQCVGQVFLSEDSEGRITGHTIVRIERDQAGKQIGLFSTFFVEPGSRNQAIATSFVVHGEKWMVEHGTHTAMTYTAETNDRLKNLLVSLGYQAVAVKNQMTALSKSLIDAGRAR